MKNITLLILSALFGFSFGLSADKSGESLPAVELKNLKGEKVDFSSLSNDGKPMVINFWATWCKPCISELDNINDVYEDWQDETGIKIVAVSIDDSRNVRRVAPFVKGRGWDYEVYTDENSDLRRALNINNPPHTLLINGEGKIVWEHNGYMPGDEDELYRKILEYTNQNEEQE
jgi:thiol-disulfide isomerase/thioredoxin